MWLAAAELAIVAVARDGTRLLAIPSGDPTAPAVRALAQWPTAFLSR
jgi:hypothetical protein